LEKVAENPTEQRLTLKDGRTAVLMIAITMLELLVLGI